MTGPDTKQFAAWSNASSFECVPPPLAVKRTRLPVQLRSDALYTARPVTRPMMLPSWEQTSAVTSVARHSSTVGMTHHCKAPARVAGWTWLPRHRFMGYGD